MSHRRLLPLVGNFGRLGNMHILTVDSRQRPVAATVQVLGLRTGLPVAVDALTMGTYRLVAEASGYLTTQRFIQYYPARSDVTIQLAVNPQQGHVVYPTDHPAYAWQEEQPLTEVQWACLANILTKAQMTVLPDGRVVTDCVGAERLKVTQDRIWCAAQPDLLSAFQPLVGWRQVSGLLHDPPDGWERQGSWKTVDPVASLQVTLFRRRDLWQAELDLDEAQGLRHVFHVLDHAVRRRRSHPFHLYDLLLAQGIDPGYDVRVTRSA